MDIEEYLCTCGLEEASEAEQVPTPEKTETETAARRRRALELGARTAAYLSTRRISDLMNFLLAQLLSHAPDRPLVFLVHLLDECMLYRAGLTNPPVLYEFKHLKELVRSFDPSERGWLSVAQLRRARATLGLETGTSSDGLLGDQIPTEEVLEMLITEQREQLLELLTAGNIEFEKKQFNNSSQDT